MTVPVFDMVRCSKFEHMTDFDMQTEDHVVLVHIARVHDVLDVRLQRHPIPEEMRAIRQLEARFGRTDRRLSRRLQEMLEAFG